MSGLTLSERAPKGECLLHLTGELVIDQDFISTWDVAQNSEH